LQTDEKSITGIQGRQILVVDDDPSVCGAIKMMLAHDGHKVQITDSGKAALALLEQRVFDVVFTDYSMSEMKGDKLAIAIKQRRPNQSIVMITAHAEVLMASGNPLTGVDFLISKPFLMADLREAVARVLPGIHNLNAVEFISAHRHSAVAHF
jgi:DNA-binding NtrC family response regulator